MNHEWTNTLRKLFFSGSFVAPRGKETMELEQHTVTVPMRYCVLTVPERNLSYQFMAAEAFWILSGDDTVKGIAPWNKNIERFSDNGETFFGAYGPKIVGQLDYVVRKLIEDRDTRQAGLTIWRENPTQTKDVPCTIAIFAFIRNDRLNISVFMRSSDVWLGLPYDVFNFSMLGHLICCRLHANGVVVSPGKLHLTAASSHLYADQWTAAQALLDVPLTTIQGETPEVLFKDEMELMWKLRVLRETKKADPLRWWEYKNAA